jgi:pimeloyl-ACP methyl ester carboxylesterase
VRRLVLVATSGGVAVEGLGGVDWRSGYRSDFPEAAEWILTDRSDHTDEIHLIEAETLLVWGDDDPISPPAVGEHLASLLPNATLRIVAGGTHSMAHDRPEDVAPLIEAHLAV